MAPGIADNQNTVRRDNSAQPSSANATSGPTSAPALSAALRTPNALPRMFGSMESAISASRGALRMPLPMRSDTRMNNTSAADCATATSGRTTQARTYPATTNGFLRWTRSDHQPLANFSSDAVDSAAPSMAPMNPAFAPSTVVRNTGRSG